MQVQKKRLLNRSVVSPPPPSVPFGPPSQAMEGFEKCSVESRSTHTSPFDDQMDGTTSAFTDAEASRLRGGPLDPLSQQDPKSHLHRQDYKEYSSFSPTQNGEQQICSAVYDQDPFLTQNPGVLPSLQLLKQGRNSRKTGGPPSQHLGASSYVAMLPEHPFPMNTRGARHVQHHFDTERGMYEGADGHYLNTGPHVEPINEWGSPGDWAGHRVPSTDSSSERLMLFSGESTAR